MPLSENPNLANKHNSFTGAAHQLLSAKKQNHSGRILSVMKTKSRSLISAPAEYVRTSSHERKAPLEPTPPTLAIDNAEPSLKMSQANGFLKEQSPVDTPRISSGRVVSPSILRSANVTMSMPEPSPTPEPAWSSAVGHASTGKSGRVIERLQGDIDRLHREKRLLKLQSEEIEKANETLVTRNQYLQDRNSNYEHSHEADVRQLERKERQIQDLREELRREKLKTARAEDAAMVAVANEEQWKSEAKEARTLAAQKETEYETIVACRNTDNKRHQGGLDKIRTNIDLLLEQRKGDLHKQKKLEIIAEQQKQTIQQLEELTKKLNSNFRAYRTEIDSAIADLRSTTSGNDQAVVKKLTEMTRVTGEMRWVMNLDRDLRHKETRTEPKPIDAGKDGSGQATDPTVDAPKKGSRTLFDMKGRHSKKKLSRSTNQ